MAAPSVFSQGALAAFASGSTITAVNPSHASGDILVVVYHTNNDGVTFSTPTGWNTVEGGIVLDGGTRGNSKCFWKRATGGSEANPATTVNVTFSASLGGYGRVYVIRGCETSGDPFDDTASAVANTTTPDPPALVTSGVDRLAFYAIAIDDDNTFTGFPTTGYTAGTHLTSTTGGDAAQNCQWKAVPTASTENPGTFTQTASDPWMIWAFAFKPPGGAAPIDGAATLTFAMATSASGTIEKVGAATTTFAFTTAAAGTREKVGAATTTFAFSTAVSGVREQLASATLGFTFTLAADWRVTVTGAASVSFSFSTAVSGVAEKIGSASIPMSFPISATGVRERVAAATLTSSFAVAVSARREAVGAAALAFSFTTAASGHRTANASATIPFSFTVVAQGVIEGQPIEGVANLSFSFSIAAAGQKTTFGAATITTAFAIAASGRREALASAMIPFSFVITGVGQRDAIGSATIPFGFSMFVSGRTDAIDAAATLTFAFTTSALGQVQRVDDVTKTRINWNPLAGLLTGLGARSQVAEGSDQGAQRPDDPEDMTNRGAAGGTRSLMRQAAKDDGPP